MIKVIYDYTKDNKYAQIIAVKENGTISYFYNKKNSTSKKNSLKAAVKSLMQDFPHVMDMVYTDVLYSYDYSTENLKKFVQIIQTAKDEYILQHYEETESTEPSWYENTTEWQTFISAMSGTIQIFSGSTPSQSEPEPLNAIAEFDTLTKAVQAMFQIIKHRMVL